MGVYAMLLVASVLISVALALRACGGITVASHKPWPSVWPCVALTAALPPPRPAPPALHPIIANAPRAGPTWRGVSSSARWREPQHAKVHIYIGSTGTLPVVYMPCALMTGAVRGPLAPPFPPGAPRPLATTWDPANPCSNASSSSWTFRRGNRGVYTCVVRGGAGQGARSVTLTLRKPSVPRPVTLPLPRPSTTPLINTYLC
ncbi:hypothetical protein GWK47_029797 [Chionoecetes opilio]|uniref:Ig-like domain-containing protein n=1 Tax=Chionoecetes opilio TaxID=41210 RepID=A0A8J5CRC8_CHIOP|nr:hypothetical protein GWK47_029797 [Chionoecetes opilio]